MTRHLLHIGYAKTATNFLRAWFDAHPQIAFVPGGFGGFRRIADIAAPAHLAAEPPRLRATSSELLATPHAEVAKTVGYGRSGETFPRDQALVCDTLHELFPGADVLIVTRGFRTMIHSAYSQYVRTGGTDGLAAFARDAQERGAWHYDRLIASYAAAFGPERLIVMPWELLRDRPAEFVGRLEERLGLDPGPVPAERPNPALSPTQIAAQLRRNRAPRLVRRLPRIGRAPPAESLDEAQVAAYRGQAASLAENPLHRPYAAEYLFRDGPA
jgi:hypothetical protein